MFRISVPHPCPNDSGRENERVPSEPTFARVLSTDPSGSSSATVTRELAGRPLAVIARVEPSPTVANAVENCETVEPSLTDHEEFGTSSLTGRGDPPC